MTGDPYVVTVSTQENPLIASVVNRAAERFEELNGLPVRVIRDPDVQGIDIAHPNFTKAFLWDLVPEEVETILYYDRDIVPVRPLGEIPEAVFAAAPDHPRGLADCKDHWPLFRKTNFMFNSGVILASRQSKPVFEMVKALQSYKRDHHKCYDQSLFNLVAQHMLEVTKLPLAWNYGVTIEKAMIPRPKMIHCCGVLERYTFMDFLLRERWES